jgi:predicted amidohydrolase
MRLTLYRTELPGASRREYRYFAARKRFLAVSQTTPRIHAQFATRTDNGQLAEVLAPLASCTVTSIVGFTEIVDDKLYNAAAVFHKGRVAGIYRKLHPAIRRSVYSAGLATPVFRVGELTFGILICYDSTFSEPARAMAAQGAKVLFVPTNNGLPTSRAYPGLVQEARASDRARALENGVWMVRADVAGANGELLSYGSSGIVDAKGNVVQETNLQTPHLLVADVVVPS